ncbi:reverse transcriptase [Phytophthora megakarya]|uniref:Reverse transcriptase n=1 Tax=Phytophthora megakarya TaxID=4795 RepID=A0A225WFW7_9STRA|nr:reverse transcriptase [Phytophthora megakarya]
MSVGIVGASRTATNVSHTKIDTSPGRNRGYRPRSHVDIGPRDSIAGGDSLRSADRFPNPEKGHPPTPPTNPDADRYRSGDAGGDGISESMPDQAPDRTGTKDIESKKENLNCQTRTKPEYGDGYGVNTQSHPTEGVELHDPPAEEAASIPRHDTEDDDEIYYHEMIVRKSNGVDIRLCIDYKLANSLTRLMVYPMPLISDLLENIDKALWYCSLDMASGFWVVPMTDRAREISAFITPFGLFEWDHMPFGLNSAKYTTDVFQTGIADDPDRHSVLGQKSYIDDIMIAPESWDQMCQRVEYLLEAFDKWTLLISVIKNFWSMNKVGYLGHRLRLIEDYAIYASVLYELREVEFAELEKRSDLRKIVHQNDPIVRDNDPPELQPAEPVDER